MVDRLAGRHDHAAGARGNRLAGMTMSATPLASSLLIPQWCVAMPDVGAWMTTRTGGVSTGAYGDGKEQGGLNLGEHVGDDAAHVACNRALLRANLPAEPAWLTQVHGCGVLDAGYIGIG